MKTVKLSLAVMVAVAALASSGAVNVAASRDYVDRKIIAVSNALDAAISSATPGSYSVVSNAAMNALPTTGGEVTGDITFRTSSGLLGGKYLTISKDGFETGVAGTPNPKTFSFPDKSGTLTLLSDLDTCIRTTTTNNMQVMNGAVRIDGIGNYGSLYLSGKNLFGASGGVIYLSDGGSGLLLNPEGVRRMTSGNFKQGLITFPTDEGMVALTKDIPSSFAWGSVTNKPSWLGDTKPSYTASEVGALGNTGDQIIVGESSDRPYFKIGFDATWPWLEFGQTLGTNRVYSPRGSGTLALLSDISVKSVKLNGTALTPDANGAVEVGAIPMSFGAAEMDPTSSYRYSTGDVMSISGKFYKAEWPFRPSTTPDPIGDEAVEELPDLKSFSEHVLRNSFLPLGYGGTNMPHYKKIDIGYESGNQRRAYLLLDTDGIDIQTRWDGEVFRIRNGKIMYTTTDWSSYYEIDVTKILTRNSVLPFSYNTEAYKDSPTSSYYVYQYLTNNYLTALGTEGVYLKKSDASTTYLSKTDAASTYDTPDGVRSKISTALQNYRPEYTYGEYGTYRTRQDGVMQRKILTSYWNVSFTNLNNGLTMKPVSGWPNKWTCDLGNSSVTVNRENGVYTCEEYPIMTATEDYDGDCVIWFSGPLGMMVADSGTFDWEDYDNLAKQSGVGGSVSNVVTQSYVREKLGVYLYIGEDGGVYVHTPTNQEEEQ